MKNKYFHGIGKRYPFFEGWYLKHQTKTQTIAFIPAVHADKKGKWDVSLQVVLSGTKNDGAWYFTWPIEECSIASDKFQVRCGKNLFSEKGIAIHIENDSVSIIGKISYSPFQQIKGNIMGFFGWFKFLQCNHGVISMSHELKGNLIINGEDVEFSGGRGYIETDWGVSFPKQYIWSQCGFGETFKNSIMISAADIPLFGRSFRGCICAIHFDGKEYRMGTYYGARILEYKNGSILIRQGNMRLKVTRLDEQAFHLRAPVNGSMRRLIKESPVCRVKYQFCRGKEEVFNIISGRASFEQVF